MKWRCSFAALCTFVASGIYSQTSKTDSLQQGNLVFPMLVEKEKRVAGNPLATYSALIDLEQRYRKSPFAPVYDEIRYNFEEFLGVSDAGKKAMSLPQFQGKGKDSSAIDLTQWVVEPVIETIKREAKKARIIIWAEEHHLPQTRSVFEQMITELWNLGYRYLAAEAFAEGLRDSTLKYINYHSGFYTQDPVYASAINHAIKLGFKLVDYDTKETSATEPSYRDIKQAENIFERVFKKDRNAKLLIIVGRGHGSEIVSGGWKPMAYNLKRLSGLDPFTFMTQTMTERELPGQEDPVYRQLAESKRLKEASTLKNLKSGEYFSSDAFDSYVFFPRTSIVNGRPDWMFHQLKRKKVNPPFDNVSLGEGLYLVQAFYKDQPSSSVPVDQFLISQADRFKSFALKPGRYRIRIIDRAGKTLAENGLKVK